MRFRNLLPQALPFPTAPSYACPPLTSQYALTAMNATNAKRSLCGRCARCIWNTMLPIPAPLNSNTTGILSDTAQHY